MSDGRTAFHIACIYGHSEFLKVLLNYNKTLPEDERFKLTNIDGAYYLSCLDYSTLFLHTKCVEYLIENGVDPKNVLSEKSEFPKLPSIYLAAFNSSIYPDRCRDVLQLYLNNNVTSFTVYFNKNNYSTVFQHAVNEGQTFFVKLLLELDHSCIDHFKMLSDGSSILELPICRGNVDLFKLLIDNGAQMNITSSQIDWYNKWIKKLPPCKRSCYGIILIKDIKTPIEHLCSSSDKEAIKIKIEMLKYVLLKGIQIDMQLAHRNNVFLTKSISIHIQRNTNQILTYENDLKSMATTSIKSSNRRLPYRQQSSALHISDKYRQFLLNTSTSYGKYITEIFDELDEYQIEILNSEDRNSRDQRIRKIQKDIDSLEENNIFLRELNSLLVQNQAPAYISPDNQIKSRDNHRIDSSDHEKSSKFRIITEYKRIHGIMSDFMNVSDDEQLKYLQFFNAIWEHDIDKIKKLSDPDTDDCVLISSIDPIGFTPFMLCAHKGYEDLIQVLVDIAKKQYTPIEKIDVTEKKQINNIDLVIGLIDEDSSNKKEEIFDPNSDFSKIRSQLSHVDILLTKRYIPINIINPRNNNNPIINSDQKYINHQYKENISYFQEHNAISLCIIKKEYQILSNIIDIIVDSDTFISEQNGDEIYYEDSGIYQLITTNPFDRSDIYQRTKSCIMSDIIGLHDINILRIYAKKLGLCYKLPCVNESSVRYHSCLWLAASKGNKEIFHYFLSDEVINDLKDFQENNNPFYTEWNEYDILNRILLQLNINFGKVEYIDEYKSSYKSVIYHASISNNIEIMRLIFELDHNIQKTDLTQVLEDCCYMGNEDVIYLLHQNGAEISLNCVRKYAQDIPTYMTKKKGGENEKDYKYTQIPRKILGKMKSSITYDLDYLEYQNKYINSIDNFNKLLEHILPDQKMEIFSLDQCFLLKLAFIKNSIKFVDVLIKHGYNLKSVNQFYQSIAHINATHSEWYKTIQEYMQSIFDTPDYQSLLNLEDGHGDTPLDIYINVYLKSLSKKQTVGNQDIVKFMDKIKSSYSSDRVLISPESVNNTLHNTNEAKENNIGGRYTHRLLKKEEQPSIYGDDDDDENNSHNLDSKDDSQKSGNSKLDITWI